MKSLLLTIVFVVFLFIVTLNIFGKRYYVFLLPKFSFYMHLFLFKKVSLLEKITAYLNDGMAKFMRVVLSVLRDKKARCLYISLGSVPKWWVTLSLSSDLGLYPSLGQPLPKVSRAWSII